MPKFEFRVEDEEGTWGDIRVDAPNMASARKKVRRWLMKDEVWPSGSLNLPFTLERINAKS